MSFRSVKLRNRKNPEFYSSMVNQFNTSDDDFRHKTSYEKKGSIRSNYKTKQTIQDLLGSIGNRIKSNKSSKNGFMIEQALRISRQSFVQQTSILHHHKNEKSDGIYNQISSKDDQIEMLENQNQSLKLLLQNQVKRIDQQGYQKIAIKQQQIQYLTDKIQTLKSKGCYINSSRQGYNEYQLQLQDHIIELDRKIEQSQSYKDELQSIVTKLYRQNINKQPSFRRSSFPLYGSCSNSLKIKIKQCIGILDDLVQ